VAYARRTATRFGSELGLSLKDPVVRDAFYEIRAEQWR
jgi:hypothetical protein